MAAAYTPAGAAGAAPNARVPAAGVVGDGDSPGTEYSALERLPMELLLRIAAFLPVRQGRALAAASRSLHEPLRQWVRMERWRTRIDRLTTVSALQRTLAELDDPQLSTAERGQWLGRLASRLAHIHGAGMSVAAPPLLRAIAALPPTDRAVPLRTLVSRCRMAVLRNLQLDGVLLEAVLSLPDAERGDLLAHALDGMPPVDRRLAGRDLAGWIEIALGLPRMAERAQVLAQLLHPFSLPPAAWRGERFAQYQGALDRLRRASGEPTAEQGEVLAALARHLIRMISPYDSSAAATFTHAWNTLFDAAVRLPPQARVVVLGALLSPHGSEPLQRYRRIWEAGMAAAVPDGLRAWWLARMVQQPLQSGSEAEQWEPVYDQARRLPAQEQAQPLAALARFTSDFQTSAQREHYWSLCFAAVRDLPAAVRMAPLLELADAASRHMEGASDTRMATLLAWMETALDRRSRLEALSRCIQHPDVSRTHWNLYLIEADQLPTSERAEALAGAARVLRCLEESMRPGAWGTLASRVAELPLHCQRLPWTELVRQSNDIELAEDEVQDVFLPLAVLSPQTRAEWLAGALGNSARGPCWSALLEQVEALPALLRPPLLARLADDASISTLSAETSVARWIDLLAAVERQPAALRGLPVGAMQALVARLPQAERSVAYKHLRLQLDDMDPLDYPLLLRPLPNTGRAEDLRALRRYRLALEGLVAASVAGGAGVEDAE